jgi:hypothetical protein
LPAPLPYHCTNAEEAQQDGGCLLGLLPLSIPKRCTTNYLLAAVECAARETASSFLLPLPAPAATSDARREPPPHQHRFDPLVTSWSSRFPFFCCLRRPLPLLAWMGSLALSICSLSWGGWVWVWVWLCEKKKPNTGLSSMESGGASPPWGGEGKKPDAAVVVRKRTRRHLPLQNVCGARCVSRTCVIVGSKQAFLFRGITDFPHLLLLETCAFGTRLWASLVYDVCLFGPGSGW